MGKVKTYLHICPSNRSNVKAIFCDSSRVVCVAVLLFTAAPGRRDVHERNDLGPRDLHVEERERRQVLLSSRRCRCGERPAEQQSVM